MITAWLVALSMAFGPQILDLTLQFDDAARQSLRRTPDADVPATLIYRDAGREQRYTVSVHVKGQLGSGRAFDDKPAFKVKFAKGIEFFGLEHLTLNNMVQDPTMLHEALGYEVYEGAGVPVPRTSYVRLHVDDQDQGLYLNVETIDRRFLERLFHDSDGILYEGAYGADLQDDLIQKLELHEGLDPDRAQLRALVRAAQAPGDGVFYGDAALVDTREFLAAAAAGIVLADWDNYYSANNYRLYWNPSVRRWSLIPTGIDQTFGSDSTAAFGGIGVLFQKCLASDRCTREYAAALLEAADRFERLGLQTRIDAWLSVIDAPSQADVRKPYDEAAMRAARDAMRAFIDGQPAQVRDAASCLASGDDALIRCAGAVIVNSADAGCLQAGSKNAGQHAPATLARCLGGEKQRWHLVATGDAFVIRSAANGDCLEFPDGEADHRRLRQATCSGADTQLFLQRPAKSGTSLVAKSSGLCIVPAPGESKTPPLAESACDASVPAQRWLVQRSIFH
jgi:CotH kinase protein/Ricin-type beta-trefoil lectin domain